MAYDPRNDPDWNPGDPYGSATNPAEKVNRPLWQGPSDQYGDFQQQILGMLGGPQGFQGTLQQIQGGAPPSLMNAMPWQRGQIDQFLTNKLSGKGARAQADKFRTTAMGETNRMFTNYANKQRSSMASGGQKGSSYDAAARAAGLGELAGARAGVNLGAQQYEDTLRNQMFGQGMQGLGALTGTMQQDISNQQGFQNQLIQSLYPMLQQYGMDIGALQGQQGMEQNQQFGENAFNQDMWNAIWAKQGGQGSGFGEALGQLLPMGAQYAMGGYGGQGFGGPDINNWGGPKK